MCAFICVGTCGSLVACGGGEEDDGTVTVIEYCIGDGGFGRAHADDLAARFMEEYANVSYAEGKMGVRVDVNVEPTTKIQNAKTNGYHVMNVSTDGPDLAGDVRLGYLAPVDDVVKEKFDRRGTELVSIEDKIPAYALGSLQGDPDENGERKYYAVPGYSYSPGLTMDENAFNINGYWLSTEDNDGEEFYSTLLQDTFYFTSSTSHGNHEPEGKSAGPDGVEGTQDDGMPASMLEFVALCEKIKSDGKSPFIAAGAYDNYQEFLYQALYCSLLGKQQLETWMNFDGREMEIVVGYTNEPLFPGFSPSKGTILKPVTKKVAINEENGYYTTWTLAEYYATAFAQLAFAEEWFHKNMYNTNHDQKSAMRDFMVSGFEPSIEESLMLIEMNFWYNEAKIGNIPQQYDAYYNSDGHEERRLTWMSLPTSFYGLTDEEIEEGVKTRQVMYTTNTNGLGIASWVMDNPEVFEACKDFVQFYCSDAQMNRWTAEIGIRKTANYEITEETLENLPWYAKKLGELMNTNMDVVFFYSENQTFKINNQDYVLGYHGSPFNHLVNGIKYNPAEYFKVSNPNRSTKIFFEAGLLTPTSWEGKYQGQYKGQLTGAALQEKLAYTLDENERPIVFNAVVPA